MQCSRKLKVTDLNPHLICVLCGGYYVDATTIIECLHSFCKSCIVRYLETNKYCPICDVQVHKTRPLQNIRPDNTLQTIVYKLVPGLYQNELRCRREFYAKHPEAKALAVSPEARGEHTEQSSIFLPDESVSLCLEYVESPDVQGGQGSCGRRYLRCPAAVSVFHIHKLIRAKFALTMGHRVDVFYKDDLLPENWSLMDVAYIYQWKRKSPIHMTYRILESQRKRIKLSHDAVQSIESFPSKTLSTSSGCGVSEPSAPPEINSSLVSLSLTSLSNLPPLETASSNLGLPSESAFTTTGMVTNTAETTTTIISTAASVAINTTAVTPASTAGLSNSLVGTVTAVTAGEIVVGSTSTTTTTTTTSTSIAAEKKEHPAAVEWKEVQLQISENGVMSVAGIDNRFLTPLQTVGVPSQNKNTDTSVKDISVEIKPDVLDERPENKVPHVDSDLNSSALHDKNVKCESRTKSVETKPTEFNEVNPSNNFSKSESVKESDLKIKSETKDKTVEIKSDPEDIKQTDPGLPPVKPVIHKLQSASDKINPIYKSKTDKLEDTVRNISSRTEPLTKPDINNMKPVHSPSLQVAKGDNTSKSDVCNSEQTSNVDGMQGKFHRPLTLSRKHKVYPGIKPVYNASKDEHLKINNLKTEPSVVCTKMTPMEILNTHKKPASTVKYKTLKTPIKPWNPSIPRAAALSMKHSQSSTHNKDVNSTASLENQPTPPPPKQPRFFKMRNMPRFLGNPSSGVKPMYQVAPGSEIVSHSNNPVSTSSSTSCTSVSSSNNSSVVSSAAVVTSVFPSIAVSSNIPVTCAAVTSVASTTTNSGTTIVSSINSQLIATSSVTVTSATNLTFVSMPPHTTIATHSNTVPKSNKPGGSSGVTLMKIDPKTLSPIPVSPMVSHVSNNPPRSTSSPQPKKLPPPFTPGSPKHSNHYTNCRTAHSNMSSGKSAIPRIPSPAHTGGLINPFLPSVVHTNPHLLYSAFPNPFTPSDPSNNRLLTGPSNSELIRAMSALCSSGSAFHSLPPSITMLFNPHHAHHRALQPDRNSFKCSSNEKQATQSPPPAVQRIPPSNPPGKNLNDTDVQQQSALNALSSTTETLLNSSRLKKESISESSVASTKHSQINPPPKKHVSADHVNQQQDSRLKLQQSQVVNSNVKNCTATTISNSVRSENKDTKPVSTHFSKPKPGEKIEELTFELLSHKSENNKTSNKTTNGSHVENRNENKVVENKLVVENKHSKEITKVSKSKDENLISNNNNCNKSLSKTDELSTNSNAPVVTEST